MQLSETGVRVDFLRESIATAVSEVQNGADLLCSPDCAITEKASFPAPDATSTSQQ
jgi:hypothetical protein